MRFSEFSQIVHCPSSIVDLQLSGALSDRNQPEVNGQFSPQQSFRLTVSNGVGGALAMQREW